MEYLNKESHWTWKYWF